MLLPLENSEGVSDPDIESPILRTEGFVLKGGRSLAPPLQKTLKPLAIQSI